jgi:hypothetical protein
LGGLCLKVLGAAPQFVQPSVPGAEKTDRNRASEELRRLRVVRTTPSEDTLAQESHDAAKESMDQQTRAGLRRLAQMIRSARREKKDGDGESSDDSRKEHGLDPRKRRAFSAYLSVAHGGDSESDKGELFDKFF